MPRMQSERHTLAVHREPHPDDTGVMMVCASTYRDRRWQPEVLFRERDLAIMNDLITGRMRNLEARDQTITTQHIGEAVAVVAHLVPGCVAQAAIGYVGHVSPLLLMLNESARMIMDQTRDLDLDTFVPTDETELLLEASWQLLHHAVHLNGLASPDRNSRTLIRTAWPIVASSVGHILESGAGPPDPIDDEMHLLRDAQMRVGNELINIMRNKGVMP